LPVPARLVSPLSVGGHMDHRLVRPAAEQLRTKLWYYADYPYAAGSTGKVEMLVPAGHEPACLELSPAALAAWQQAVGCYESQISTFWGSLEQMEKAVAEYSLLSGCHSFWQPR
jgi:hypothetical protein